MKKKLLITGASGFLGYHLLRVCAATWEVYGIYHNRAFDFAGATALNCDLTNYIELGNCIDDVEPDAVIHAAALADANFCQQNPGLSHKINVEASCNLAGICSDFQIPFAFISTDLVFDGKRGLYTEEDEKHPLSIYGEHKAVAEDEILEIYPDASIFRVPLMFGYPQASNGNYLHRFLQQMEQRQPVNLFTDEYRSVCGAKSISTGIAQLLGRVQGIVHLGGNRRLSRYEFGMMAADAFGLDKSLLKPVSQKDFASAAPRPADVSLDINKSINLGFIPPDTNFELGLIAGLKYF